MNISPGQRATELQRQGSLNLANLLSAEESSLIASETMLRQCYQPYKRSFAPETTSGVQASLDMDDQRKRRRIENTVIPHGGLKQPIPLKKAKWWTQSHLVALRSKETDPSSNDQNITSSTMSSQQVPSIVSTDSLNRCMTTKKFSGDAHEPISAFLARTNSNLGSSQPMDLVSYFTRRANATKHLTRNSSAALQNIAISHDRPYRGASIQAMHPLQTNNASMELVHRLNMDFPPAPSQRSSPRPANSSNSEDGSQDGNTASSESSATLSFRAYQAENWTEKFEELLLFRREHGHCLVPNSFPENQALAQWVKRQRYQYKLKLENKRSTMSDERVNALDRVGFVWFSHAAVWDEHIQELQEFKRLNGHCNVPSRYAENRQLAVWVKRQRRQYKFYQDGKPSSMTPQRILRLEAIGFMWDLTR